MQTIWNVVNADLKKQKQKNLVNADCLELVNAVFFFFFYLGGCKLFGTW